MDFTGKRRPQTEDLIKLHLGHLNQAHWLRGLYIGYNLWTLETPGSVPESVTFSNLSLSLMNSLHLAIRKFLYWKFNLAKKNLCRWIYLMGHDPQCNGSAGIREQEFITFLPLSYLSTNPDGGSFCEITNLKENVGRAMVRSREHLKPCKLCSINNSVFAVSSVPR